MFKQNRERLCARLRKNKDVPKGAMVLLQGGEADTRNCSDHEPLFRQVKCFDICFISNRTNCYKRYFDDFLALLERKNNGQPPIIISEGIGVELPKFRKLDPNIGGI
jgi:hypothetical protein